MRILTIIIFLLLSFVSFAQIEFIGTHPHITNLINIDKGEPVIFDYDRQNEIIELYAQDNSLISSFEIPYEYEGWGQYNLYHVSRKLFDCDSTNIEYMITRSDGSDSTQVWVKILRDDGAEIFSLTNHGYLDNATSSGWGDGLIQVDDGVLIRFHSGSSPGSNGNEYKIYKSTCGTVPGPLANNEGSNNPVGIAESDFVKAKFMLFPNPGEDILNINYDLPKDMKTGQLSVYNDVGQMIYEKKVGSLMDYLIVNVAEWNS